MRCAVPGCSTPPVGESVRVKASRHSSLDRLPLRRMPDDGEPVAPDSVALAELCGQHREEFERLGWVEAEPVEEDDG